MYWSDVAALVLFVAALTVLLFGAILALTPFMIDVSAWLPGGNDPVQDWLVAHPGIVGLAMILVFSVPAIFLAGAGWSVWRFIGGKHRRRAEETIDSYKDRTEVLLRWLDEIIGALLRSSVSAREAIQRGMVEAWPRLEPDRQRRVAAFLQEHRLDPPGATAVSPSGSSSIQVPWSPKAVKGIAFLLSLASAFMMMWGVLAAVTHLTAQPLESMGIKTGPGEAAQAAFSCFSLAMAPLAAALGLLWLLRGDRRLRLRRESAAAAIRQRVLGWYRDHIRRFVQEGGLGSPTEKQQLRSLAASLTRITVPEMDVAGHRALREFLEEVGLGPDLLSTAAQQERGA